MVNKQITKFPEFRVKWKYEILLVSFLILLFGDVFFSKNFDPMPFLIFQNVLASAVIFYGKKKWRLPLAILLIFLITIELVDWFFGFKMSGLLSSSIYIIYFILLSVEVYRQIFYAKDVDGGTIAAVLCGFIIMCLVGGFVFSIIEFSQPNSFNNLDQGIGKFSDLIYFSFITILSIGFGDITPASKLAQKITMFFGLIGYFYGVVVIGIIMGKFLARRN